MLQVNCSRGI